MFILRNYEIKHLEGMKLPKLRLILDYLSMTLLYFDGQKFCDLKDFDFDIGEEHENYHMNFENDPNVAQQIYSRHSKIKDSNRIYNIFDIINI
jgi:hypothetical protein